MLLQLSIKNFALIEEITLDLDEGFTILAGETGAGKSILIDAINYVLGSKFNKDLIRTGEEKTFVEAICSIEDNKSLKEILDFYDIEYDDILIISRESFKNGKSVIRVNGKAIILSNLRKISEKLIDIHGQHSNQNLLNKDRHIEYLDSFGKINLENDFIKYKESFVEFKDIKDKILSLNKNESDEKLVDYIKYQIEEIDNASLIAGEEERLIDRYNILSNHEKIRNSLARSYSYLDSSTGEYSVLDSLDFVVREISAIEKHSEKAKLIKERVNNTYYELQDLTKDIKSLLDESYYDENELDEINSRIYKIGLLKKKYGSSIEEILKYRENLDKQYQEIINSEEIIKELKNKLIVIEKRLDKYSKNIHEKRVILGKAIEEKIEKEFKYVGLGKCTFKISIEYDDSFNLKGKDKVQFMISTNLGEPIKPMEKIVSGGELSRIMLSLKSVFIDKDNTPTIIFDEIDTGISGRIAQCVAEKMYEISNKHQVLCITHLPQIASMSDNHYMVKKYIENEKTFTKIEKINEEKKIEEIAIMLGGVKLTENTLTNAREIIELANKKKNIIMKNNT
ncbi:DNA repair protein RecN [Sarcina sp. JB2]|uniref:DNA repair protein RecN n=1 Tax=Candidatus Sarcina troglodytae TaxID=2726954 RepID=A0ACD1BE84_9CLOT|nr:DNA repair protein RecN [Sarcina sp. JB2]QPJ85738.1 DNA repair protein RecN [Sarcina sp. JB2]